MEPFFSDQQKLWTSSYVLFAGGLSLLLLAFCLLIVDVSANNSTKPSRRRFLTIFLVFGTNAIAAYIFSELLQSTLGSIHLLPGLNLQQWLYWSIQRIAPNQAFASLVYSMGFVAVCFIPASLLYRRNIFIKI
jgi:predicted acyltransferase